MPPETATLPTETEKKSVAELRAELLAELKKQQDQDHEKRDVALVDKLMTKFDARADALEKAVNDRFPQYSLPGAPEVGEQKDQFCLGRAANAIYSGDWSKAGHEKEVFEQTKKSMTTTNDPTGAWVMPMQISNRIIEPLRKSVIAFKLGMREESNEGYVGYQMRRLVTDLTNSSWNAELVAATPGDIGLGNIDLRPRSLVAAHDSSKLAMRASPGLVQGMVINSGKEIFRRKIDFAALQGSGVSNEPLGVINLDFVNTGAFALDGTGDYDEVLDFVQKVRAADALNDANTATTGWALSAAKFNALMKIKDPTDSSQPTGRRIIANGPESTLLGFKYAFTTALPATGAGAAIFGDWSTSFFLGFGNGMEINVTDAGRTNALANQVSIVLTQYCDIGFEQPLAFVVSSS